MRYILSKNGKKMILIHPYSNEVIQRFPDQPDHIMLIEKYFGRKGDQEVINNTMKEELRKL